MKSQKKNKSEVLHSAEVKLSLILKKEKPHPRRDETPINMI